MSKFLIDANLPRRLRFGQEDDCEFVPDTQWPDHLIWQYAKERQLIIITKDADFGKLALTVGPPVVIHLRAGNCWRSGGPRPVRLPSNLAAGSCEYFPIA